MVVCLIPRLFVLAGLVSHRFSLAFSLRHRGTISCADRPTSRDRRHTSEWNRPHLVLLPSSSCRTCSPTCRRRSTCRRRTSSAFTPPSETRRRRDQVRPHTTTHRGTSLATRLTCACVLFCSLVGEVSPLLRLRGPRRAAPSKHRSAHRHTHHRQQQHQRTWETREEAPTLKPHRPATCRLTHVRGSLSLLLLR